MTPTEWKALPALVSRADVIAAGIRVDALPDLTQVVPSTDAPVAPRKIAAVRGLRGRASRRKGPGNLLFIKSTVSVLLPREYR